jgi:hypothetical protein
VKRTRLRFGKIQRGVQQPRACRGLR